MNDYPKVFRNGKLVPKWSAEPRYPNQSAPFVISDNMDPLKHHGTGRIIDSKAKFRAETRAIGAIELGTEKIREGPKPQIRLDKRQRREDIKRAIYNLRNHTR